jgi:hypothetical protein
LNPEPQRINELILNLERRLRALVALERVKSVSRADAIDWKGRADERVERAAEGHADASDEIVRLLAS